MKRSCIPALVLLLAGGLTCAAILAQAPATDQQSDKPGLVDSLPNQPLTVPRLGGNHSALWGQIGFRNKSHDLAKQYVNTEKEAEKTKIRKELTEVLGQQFDAQAKQQEKELADLEKQVAKLRDTLKKRQQNKTAIIDRRIEQLIQEAQGLGWTAPSTPQSGAHLVPVNRLAPSPAGPAPK